MVDKPPVEFLFLSVCRTWHGISVDEAIPKRLDQFNLFFHRKLANLFEQGCTHSPTIPLVAGSS
jgi:hypothetical protein